MTQPKHKLVNTDEGLRKAWEWINKGEAIGYDTETAGGSIVWRKKSRPEPMSHRIVGLSLCRDNTAIYIPVRHYEGPNVSEEALRELLQALLQRARAGRVVWMHNMAYELDILINEGALAAHSATPSGFRCSAVASWLSWTKRGSELKLKVLAGEILGERDLPSFEAVAQGRSANQVPPTEMCAYAANDAWLTLRLGQTAWQRLEDEDLTEHYLTLDLPLVEVLRGAQREGIGLDVPALEALRVEWTAKCQELAKRFEELTTTEVTIPVTQDVPTGAFYKTGKRAGEPKTRKELVPTKLTRGARVSNDIEVSKWCYEYLKCWPIPTEWDRREEDYRPIERNGHGVYSASADYIEAYQALPGLGGEAARVRLEYQRYSKLVTTYLDVMLDLPQQYVDGNLHPSLSLTGTRTQRFSSSGPNFQNIPARHETGKQIRKAIHAARPGWLLVVRDYSQIELRLQADIAKDVLWTTGYLAAAEFGVKYDLHQEAADKIGIPRSAGKVVNLSVQYGVSEDTLAAQIVSSGTPMDRDQAKQLIDDFYLLHPGITEYQERCKRFATKHGYIYTPDGYKRFNLECYWSHKLQRKCLTSHDARAASNTPVQGGAAAILKASMLELWRHWTKAGIYGTQVVMVGSVHDEVLVACHPDVAERVGRDMDRIMVKPRFKFKVPLAVEGGCATNWAEAKP